MNSKVIGVTAIFTALTIILSQIRIPAPFPPPGFTYQMYQIPIVIVFLLVGPKYGVAVAFLNMLATMVMPWGPMGILGPPYGFLITLTLLFGVYFSLRIFNLRPLSKDKFRVKNVAIFTIISTLSRTIIALPLDYIAFGVLLSISLGISVPEAYAFAIGIMPGIIVFNLIVPLYVIPISYAITNKISKHYEIKIKLE